MCVSKNASVLAFVTCLVSSVALWKYGIRTYSDENRVIIFFFMYVSLMQWVDFGIWSDLDCTSGWNALATRMGPWLNNLQPFVLCVLVGWIMGSKFLLFTSVVYGAFVVYKNLTSQMDVCTRTFDNADACPARQLDTCNGGLRWQWNQVFPYVWYHIVMGIVGMWAVVHGKMSFVFALMLSYVFFAIEVFKNKRRVGEMWCFLVNCVPLATLLFQKVAPR